MITADGVIRVILDHGMIREGDRVTAGISGGADSMCLLFLMSEIREKLRFSLDVVHVNHGIRGKDADDDEDFVRRTAENLGIPCRVVKVDVPLFAKENSLSEEEAGRILRYRALREEKPDRIAVAHHAGDSAETVLFNLFRGTGLKGLSGIRPVSGDIIRPLIYFTREETEGYLKERGIPFREDFTNKDVSYGRNRIRMNIIPEAELVNSGAVKHILEASEKIREACLHIDREAEEVFLRSAERSEEPAGVTLDIDGVSGTDRCVRELVLKKCIIALTDSEKDITSAHLKDAAGLMEKQSGKQISLPYGVSVKRSFGKLTFFREDKREPEKEGLTEIPLMVDEGRESETVLPDGSVVIAGLEDRKSPVPNLKYTKWLDYDKIKGRAVWRTRRPGDRISIKGGSRKLKDLLIEEKIPAEKRDSLYFLAVSDSVVWIPGFRIGEDYKVSESTERVVKISLQVS